MNSCDFLMVNYGTPYKSDNNLECLKALFFERTMETLVEICVFPCMEETRGC